jgi:hypothetical protein
MTTTLNGIEITSGISEILKKWNENDGPERYVSYLSDVQDFLCYQLTYVDHCQEAERLLSQIIYIKDDLRKFIPEEGSES